MATAAQNLLQGPVYNRIALDASLARKRPGVTPDDQVPLLARKALQATTVSEFTEADPLLLKKAVAAPADPRAGRIAKAHLAATVVQAVFAILAVIPLTRFVGLAGSRVVGIATGALAASQAKGAVALAQRTAIIVATVIGFASLFAAAPVLSTVSLFTQSAVSLSEALKALSKKEWKATLFHLLMAASTAVAAGAILSKSLELAIASLAMSLVITIGFVLYAVKQRDPISALCYLTMAATQTFSLAETGKLLVERNRLQVEKNRIDAILSKPDRTGKAVVTAPHNRDLILRFSGDGKMLIIPQGESRTITVPINGSWVDVLSRGGTTAYHWAEDRWYEGMIWSHSDSHNQLELDGRFPSARITIDNSATTPTTPSPALAGFWRS